MTHNRGHYMGVEPGELSKALSVWWSTYCVRKEKGETVVA